MKRNKFVFMHSFWGAVITGMIAALGVGCILLFVFSCICMGFQTPIAYLVPFGLLGLSCSMVAGGWVTTKLWGHHSPLPALLTGGVLALFLIAVGLCFPGSTLPAAIRLAGGPIGVVLAFAGGVIGASQKKKRRKRRM